MHKRFDVSQTAHRWPGILSALGVDAKTLSKRNVPCPFCGGTDRFRFTDHEGQGLWFCNQCGAGNGVQFVQKFLNLDFVAAMKAVEMVLPSVEREPLQKKTDPRAKLNALWNRSRPLAAAGDTVYDYLTSRGVICDPLSTEIRSAQEVPYWQDNKIVGYYDAMVTRVRREGGKPSSLHVTYLKDGAKAEVPSPKKVLSSPGKGAHIALYPAERILAVAEGIETALAVRRHTGGTMAVWSTLSAGGMREIVVPSVVEELQIFADNDRSFTGQAAAYHLANRLMTTARGANLRVIVRIPRHVGDWADAENWEA